MVTTLFPSIVYHVYAGYPPHTKKKKKHFRFAKAQKQFANDEAHLKHNACRLSSPGMRMDALTRMTGGKHVVGITVPKLSWVPGWLASLGHGVKKSGDSS